MFDPEEEEVLYSLLGLVVGVLMASIFLILTASAVFFLCEIFSKVTL